MTSAKFLVVGETGLWTRTRIQEEITAHGLDGTVVDAGEHKLGVFVSGNRQRIQKLYNDLAKNLPADVQPTNLIYGEFKRPAATGAPASSADAFQTLIELLREIEKNTRKMNQKLDKLIAGRQAALYETSGPEETTKEWGWTSDSKKDDDDEGGGTATGAFAQMFG